MSWEQGHRGSQSLDPLLQSSSMTPGEDNPPTPPGLSQSLALAALLSKPMFWGTPEGLSRNLESAPYQQPPMGRGRVSQQGGPLLPGLGSQREPGESRGSVTGVGAEARKTQSRDRSGGQAETEAEAEGGQGPSKLSACSPSQALTTNARPGCAHTLGPLQALAGSRDGQPCQETVQQCVRLSLKLSSSVCAAGLGAGLTHTVSVFL